MMNSDSLVPMGFLVLYSVTGDLRSGFGDSNDNTLIGGAGYDRLDGGTGADTADYSASAAGVTVDISNSGDQNTVGTGIDRLTSIENVTGSAFSDTLKGSGGDDVIKGGQGNDPLDGGSGSDTFTYSVGDGNDVVHGGAGSGWIDTISLSSGTSALGALGSDRTVSIASGSIVSTDIANHTMMLSQDAAGSINLSNGTTLDFSEIEKIAW